MMQMDVYNQLKVHTRNECSFNDTDYFFFWNVPNIQQPSIFSGDIEICPILIDLSKKWQCWRNNVVDPHLTYKNFSW